MDLGVPRNEDRGRQRLFRLASVTLVRQKRQVARLRVFNARHASNLDVGVALRFLEDARAYGIGILGFTGGEPFLYPEFLHTLCRRAADLGFRFDKIVTNGVWFKDERHLVKVLRSLRRAGYTGKLGLSVDKFHGSHTRDFALFCRTARAVFGRDNILSLSYASRRPDQGLEPVRATASESCS